jgi:hypothetical protein
MWYVTCVWDQEPAPKLLQPREGKLQLQAPLAISLVWGLIYLGIV